MRGRLVRWVSASAVLFCFFVFVVVRLAPILNHDPEKGIKGGQGESNLHTVDKAPPFRKNGNEGSQGDDHGLNETEGIECLIAHFVSPFS